LENRIPSGYYDEAKTKPYYITFVAVDRVTGKETYGLHPKDLPREKRQEIADRFAAKFKYKRIS
jgi:hypothetical protein